MGTPLLIFVTVAYLFCAVDFAAKQNLGMAMVFGGYCFANVGLLIATWK